VEPLRRLLNALFALCLLALAGTPAFAADFVVSKTTDSTDGICNADCSLREAVIAANASPGADRIILGSGLTYTLTLGPADPSGTMVPGSGDLDVTDALTIDGNGSTIDAALLDRVLDIQGSFTVTINNLTIKNGLASGFLSLGGGLNIRGATVVLNNCIVTGNSTAVESGARDGGGGIAVVGSYGTPGGVATLASLSLVNSTVSGNSGLNGGGILCVLCSLTIAGSTISGNTASGTDGGGIGVVGSASALSMNGGALVSNSVTGPSSQGGGLSVPFGTSVSTLDRSRIAANTATAGSAVFESVGTATATNNWWGCNFGPGTGGSGCIGTPNGAAGAVTSAPFLILTTTASPASIGPGGSSTVTANLTINSVSANTSGGGTVPNGVVAAFAGTLGTFATLTATTTSGKATDLFTNNGVAGLASVSATVDGQTASATLVVVGAPTVITGAAGGIGASSATLNGTANPNGAAAMGQFQYGPTTAYGSATPAQGLGGGSGQVAIGGGGLTGLACATLYHFRATATNGAGTTNGLDATFTTAACPPPTVTTGAAGPIHATGAYIQAMVNPNGAVSTVTVEYGLTTSYGSASLPLSVPSGASAVPVGRLASGLTCNTLYHFRAVATNANGSGFGSDATFTSGACGFPTRTLLWRHQVTGQNAVWLMNGPVLQAAAFLPTLADLRWTIVATGDIDGDGQEDIVWHHTSTGQTAVWFLNGTDAARSIFLPTVADPNWTIGGMQDFDGDGKADLLWHNAATGETTIWFLNGTGLVSSAYVPIVVGTDWKIAGVADFNGDGQGDLLWRNNATGESAIWLMDGATPTTGAFLPQLYAPWTISGVGDLDGDGRADIVWRNTASGQNACWFMNGATADKGAYLLTVPAPDWFIARVADIDGDGASDLVWRSIEGDNALWQMNGDQLLAGTFMLSVTDPHWELIGR
jgi:CSLREA domain-containing protein